jgi:hypothetical protein
MTTFTSPPTLLQSLPDGLVLRTATPADASALADFNARVHSDDGEDKPDEAVRVWTYDLLTRPHPTLTPADFLVVEDTRTGDIASTTMWIPQTWAYGGVPFGVGRPELVATAPAYRRRGLVRRQMEVLHRWSLARGHLVQAITGIPNYYRQFGYEMALSLDSGRSGFAPQVPRLPEGAAELYRVRPAAEADLAFVARVYDQTVAQRDLVSVVRDPALWQYELAGRSPASLEGWSLFILETAAGEPAGYLTHLRKVWPGSAGVRIVLLAYELAPGHSWLAATPSVIRYLWQTGEAYAAQQGLSLQRFAFGLGEQHPVYDAFPETLPVARGAYAWYLRVPDLPGFVRHVAPVLERRLAQSVAAGHSAELKLNFYQGGLRLVLERGRLAAVEPWQAPDTNEMGSAGFPALTFLQLLFGYRSLDELRHAYADCYANGDINHALLNALFPKQASNLWPVA